MFIYPYRVESSSAKALAVALGAKRILLEGSKFRGSKDKIVINWGNSMTNEELEKASVLNRPEAVKDASNKLSFFRKVEGQIPIPDYTTDRNVARTWLADGGIVVARTILNGHSGAGITLLEDVMTFDAHNHAGIRLYTRYIPKKHEYRVHVIGGAVVDVQQKRVHKEAANPNWKIRNHHTGFIYARENVELPSPKIAEDCIRCVELCELHFGAVDVIWNNHRNVGYILEVNTAPGLEGQTITSYANAFANIPTETIGPLPLHWDIARAVRPRRTIAPGQFVMGDEVGEMAQVVPVPEADNTQEDPRDRLQVFLEAERARIGNINPWVTFDGEPI